MKKAPQQTKAYNILKIWYNQSVIVTTFSDLSQS